MKEIYEMHGRGRSARAIARDLGLARNTVLRHLTSPEAMLPKPRPPRGSRLDPHAEHIDRRLAEGLENCVVLLRELRARRYRGSCTILVEYVRPRRRGRQPEATMRFETAPGEQAQVDWGSLPYAGEDGKLRRVRVFVMTMSWSRACLRSWFGGRTPPPSSSAMPMLSSTWAAFPAAACTTTPRW